MKNYLLVFALVLFATSAYATAMSASGVKAIGGTGQTTVPTNAVQVTQTAFFLNNAQTSTTSFNQVQLTLQVSSSTYAGTYTIYITVYINSVVVATGSASATLSTTPVNVLIPATGNFGTQTQPQNGQPIEVDVVAAH